MLAQLKSFTVRTRSSRVLPLPSVEQNPAGCIEAPTWEGDVTPLRLRMQGAGHARAAPAPWLQIYRLALCALSACVLRFPKLANEYNLVITTKTVLVGSQLTVYCFFWFQSTFLFHEHIFITAATCVFLSIGFFSPPLFSLSLEQSLISK